MLSYSQVFIFGKMKRGMKIKNVQKILETVNNIVKRLKITRKGYKKSERQVSRKKDKNIKIMEMVEKLQKPKKSKLIITSQKNEKEMIKVNHYGKMFGCRKRKKNDQILKNI